jgi:hypothetical protein
MLLEEDLADAAVVGRPVIAIPDLARRWQGTRPPSTPAVLPATRTTRFWNRFPNHNDVGRSSNRDGAGQGPPVSNSIGLMFCNGEALRVHGPKSYSHHALVDSRSAEGSRNGRRASEDPPAGGIVSVAMCIVVVLAFALLRGPAFIGRRVESAIRRFKDGPPNQSCGTPSRREGVRYDKF